MTPVKLSTAAAADLAEIVDYYLTLVGPDVAEGYVAAWDCCLDHIAAFPASGSARLGQLLDLESVRVWPVKGFPYLAIYRQDAQQVIVLRILHGARDIPAALRD